MFDFMVLATVSRCYSKDISTCYCVPMDNVIKLSDVLFSALSPAIPIQCCSVVSCNEIFIS